MESSIARLKQNCWIENGTSPITRWKGKFENHRKNCACYPQTNVFVGESLIEQMSIFSQFDFLTATLPKTTILNDIYQTGWAWMAKPACCVFFARWFCPKQIYVHLLDLFGLMYCCLIKKMYYWWIWWVLYQPMCIKVMKLISAFVSVWKGNDLFSMRAF